MAQNPYNDLLQMVKSMEDDFSKFYDKSNKAAGTRVRKSMQELKDRAQQIRLEVQNMKNEGQYFFLVLTLTNDLTEVVCFFYTPHNPIPKL